MKLLATIMCVTGFALSLFSMEERENPTQEITLRANKLRTIDEQHHLDYQLDTLFDDKDFLKKGAENAEQSRVLIRNGATVRNFKMALAAWNLLGNVLPLIILFREGLDINSGSLVQEILHKAPFVKKRGDSYTHSNNRLINSDWRAHKHEGGLDEVTQTLTGWPRGPFVAHSRWFEQEKLHATLADNIEEFFELAQKPRNNKERLDKLESEVFLSRFLLKIDRIMSDLFHWLIEQGADINVLDRNKMSWLRLIARDYQTSADSGRRSLYLKFFKLLVYNGARINPTIEVEKQTTRQILFQDFENSEELTNIIENLLFREEDQAISDLNSLLDRAQGKEPSILPNFLIDILRLAIVQRHPRMALSILKNVAARGVLNSNRYKLVLLFLAAAQTGQVEVFSELMHFIDFAHPVDKEILNHALLAAAAQGYHLIVEQLVDANTFELEEVTAENSEGRSSKKRKLQHTYNPLEIIQPMVAYYAITRAARQGHAHVVRILLRKIKTITLQSAVAQRLQINNYKNQVQRAADEVLDLKKKQWLRKLCTKAVELALVRGDEEVLEAILSIDELDSLIDYKHITTLQTISANPFYTTQERENYRRLMHLIAARMRLVTLINRENRLVREGKIDLDGGLLLGLPYEIIEYLFSFLRLTDRPVITPEEAGTSDGLTQGEHEFRQCLGDMPPYLLAELMGRLKYMREK